MESALATPTPPPGPGVSVLFVSNDPSIFDSASAARARMRAYAARLGALHVLSRGSGEPLQEGNLYLYPVRGPKLLAIRALPRRAKAVLAEHPIDVVSAQDPFEFGAIARRAIAGTRAKLHVQVHTDFRSPWFVRGVRLPMALRNLVRRRIAGRTLATAAGIRAVSHRVADSIARAHPNAARASVIPIPVDPALPASAALPPAVRSFAFFAVGRLEAEKRVGDLIRALPAVLATYPYVSLVVAGDGRERRALVRLARSLGISRNVIFLGARPDARALMRSAHAFVQASAYEGYGLSLVEAALARLPIVTTDVGIVGEVLLPNEDAYVVPVGDVAALGRAMRAVIENAADRERMIRSAEARVQAHLAAAGDGASALAADLARTAAGIPAP